MEKIEGEYPWFNQIKALKKERDRLNGTEYPLISQIIHREIELIQSGQELVKFIDIGSPNHTKVTFKLVLPTKDHPEVCHMQNSLEPFYNKNANFVGRIVGQAGMTVKFLQKITGCKVAVFGKGSTRDKNKEEELRQQGGRYQHLNFDLHAQLESFGPPLACYQRIINAMTLINALCSPSFVEGTDAIAFLSAQHPALVNSAIPGAPKSNHVQTRPMGMLPPQHAAAISTLPPHMVRPPMGAMLPPPHMRVPRPAVPGGGVRAGGYVPPRVGGLASQQGGSSNLSAGGRTANGSGRNKMISGSSSRGSVSSPHANPYGTSGKTVASSKAKAAANYLSAYAAYTRPEANGSSYATIRDPYAPYESESSPFETVDPYSQAAAAAAYGEDFEYFYGFEGADPYAYSWEPLRESGSATQASHYGKVATSRTSSSHKARPY